MVITKKLLGALVHAKISRLCVGIFGVLVGVPRGRWTRGLRSMIYTCRTLCKFKSDTDRLYTAGDRVTHIETGTGKFSVLDRDET